MIQTVVADYFWLHRQQLGDKLTRLLAPFSWAERLNRVSKTDIELCPKCGGQLRVIAAITQPDVIKKIRQLGVVEQQGYEDATLLAFGRFIYDEIRFNRTTRLGNNHISAVFDGFGDNFAKRWSRLNILIPPHRPPLRRENIHERTDPLPVFRCIGQEYIGHQVTTGSLQSHAGFWFNIDSS